MYDVRLEERVSSKSGKKYAVLVVTFPCGYEKVVFLESAELALARLSV